MPSGLRTIFQSSMTKNAKNPMNTINDFIIILNTKSLLLILGVLLLSSCESDNTPTFYVDDGEKQYFEDYEPPKFKWGLIDTKGNVVLDAVYDDLKDPIDINHIPASLAGKWSYISLEGKPIVPHQFKSVLNWSDNVGWGQNFKNTYHIVTTNRVSDTIKASRVKPFSNDLAAIKDNSGWNYIDKSGKIIIKHNYNSAGNFNEQQQAIIKTQDGFGVIDKDGTEIIAAQYQSLKEEHNGYIAKKENKYTYIDHSGKQWIKNSFSKVTPFYENRALVKTTEGYQLIDKKGRVVKVLPYSLVTEGGQGYWKYQVDGLWGVLDGEGDIVCTPKFSDSYRYQEGFLTASIDQTWGMVDQSCDEVLPFTHPILWSFREGYSRIITNGFFQVIDTSGQVHPNINEIELKEFVNGYARYQHYPIYDKGK